MLKKVLKWEYIGCTGGNIKARISEHYSSFKNKEKINATKLSEQMWKEKERGEVTELTWEKMRRAPARKPNQKSCNLCNFETMEIMRRGTLSLNSREELGGYCPHRRGYLLENIGVNKEDLKLKRIEKQCKKELYLDKQKYG